MYGAEIMWYTPPVRGMIIFSADTAGPVNPNDERQTMRIAVSSILLMADSSFCLRTNVAFNNQPLTSIISGEVEGAM